MKLCAVLSALVLASFTLAAPSRDLAERDDCGPSLYPLIHKEGSSCDGDYDTGRDVCNCELTEILRCVGGKWEPVEYCMNNQPVCQVDATSTWCQNNVPIISGSDPMASPSPTPAPFKPWP